MAYQPKVVDAKIVSENEENGFFEVVVELADHNRCRLTFERDLETNAPFVTDISRLYKVPCAICKKDYLCYCYTRFKEDIASQALELLQ